MADDVLQDQLVVIRIEGMHCHRCEQTVKKSLSALPGVHEVEVDFPSAQASVLYAKKAVNVKQLMEAVNQAGYKATGFVQPSSSKPAKG